MLRNPNQVLRALTILLLFTSFCSKVPYRSTPDTPGLHHFSVLIRSKVKQNGRKDKVKILLKYSNKGDNLIFLGPLNQILFEVLIINSKTTIIIPRKKKFWEGDFSQFIKKIWGIRADYPELKNLLIHKVIPERLSSDSLCDISIKNPKKKGAPGKVFISDSKTELEFKVYKVKKKDGAINFERELDRYRNISLEEFIGKKISENV